MRDVLLVVFIVIVITSLVLLGAWSHDKDVKKMA